MGRSIHWPAGITCDSGDFSGDIQQEYRPVFADPTGKALTYFPHGVIFYDIFYDVVFLYLTQNMCHSALWIGGHPEQSVVRLGGALPL
ncbi:hypothetical protein [Telmatospirillum sp.]|uniref:hypothetical protein n=1 Tax=Telmatospirillum sp. TaxID=2079197 RepID=UPI00284F868D|nr:hypothetical protein [Telmatospirillum sp.]MDR3439069.1 hypothetical protein [Telmatospirillum sp.]